jgi:hypothetical protein
VAPVGIVANPLSGKDVRRLLTNAATSSLEDKVNVVRRLLVGAAEAGASELVVLAEPHGVVRRALRTLPFAPDLTITEVPAPLRHDERDTMCAAAAMREAGCAAVVVLGGDGTNRAVALGWPGVPVIPLSTGTNNAFPEATEATIAGAAAGHLATGAVALADVAVAAKVIDVEVEGEPGDVALVDAVLLREPRSALGALTPFDPASLVEAVLARAEPAAVGASSIGGVLVPSRPGDDIGVGVSFAPVGAGAIRVVRAPLAPGTFSDVGVTGWRPLALGQPVRVEGPGVLAFDGDRRRHLQPGQGAVLRVQRTGPMVIDVALVLRAGTVRSHWVRAVR